MDPGLNGHGTDCAGRVPALDALTRRQVEVARAAVSGLSNKELAQRLGVSEGTIKNHLHAIYERLKVDGRLALLLYLKEKEKAARLRDSGGALRYLRHYGLRRGLKRLFAAYIFARQRMYVTYLDCIEDTKIPLNMAGFEVRLARPDDPLAEAFPHLKPSTIENWLRPDHLLFVILHEGKLAGYRCVATGAGPALNRFFRLRPDQLFVANHYIRPEFRRGGLSRITKLAVARDLVARGVREVFATESPTNYDSILSAAGRGTRRLGTLTRTCVLGRVRFAMTPTTSLSPDLVLRQLALLKQVAPAVSHVGLLFNPSVLMAATETEPATRAAVAELGTEVTFLPVCEAADQVGALDNAFSMAREKGVRGLIVLSDPMMKEHRSAIVSLVNRHRLPAIFDAEEFVAAGGLMSYGSPAPSLRDFDSVVAYVDTLKAGHPPADRRDPDLVVNGKTAIALGLVVPPGLLAQPPTVRTTWTDARPRLLFCTAGYVPDPVAGAAHQAVRQAEELQRRGYPVTIVAPRHFASRSTQLNGVKVHRIPYLRWPGCGTVSCLLTLFAFLLWTLRRFHVVHLHGCYFQTEIICLAAWLWRRPVYIKIALGGERGDVLRLHRRRWLSLGIVFRSARGFQAISDEIAQELLAAGVAPARIFRIPNGVDLAQYTRPAEADRRELRRRLDLAGDATVVLYAGRFSRMKGLTVLVDAWSRLNTSNALLVLVGHRGGAQDGRWPANVLVRDWTNELADYYAAADIFVLPSSGEGMSNAMLEAMASGLPVIATRVGAAESLIEDGVTGCLVTAGDPARLGEALHALMVDTALRSRLAAAGQRRLRDAYSIESVVDRLESAYRTITSP